jgi:putative ABC transport system ATP-binding protein
MNESPETMMHSQAAPATTVTSASASASAAEAEAEAEAAPVSRGTLLETRGVYRSFGQTPALRGADLAVGAGEILAVMGPSGSGKSTLLHCLAGIYTPDAGGVIFDGRRIDTLSDAERTVLRRTSFGFVFQFGQLVPELTTADNVALPLLLSGVKRKEAYQKAASWLDRLGLADLGARRTGELSGGQAQRVAIARALAPRPRVVFADEPTGSLDSLTGERVMDLLIETARQENATVVLVTHDARVAAYAERMVMVRDGKVIAPAETASEVVR